MLNNYQNKIWYPLYLTCITFIFIQCNDHDTCNYHNLNETFYDNQKDKFWQHRVNKIDSIKKYYNSFSGIEFDLFYDRISKSFVCKHDREEKGIPLNSLLEITKANTELYYWIDLKHSDEVKPVDSALQILDDVLSKYHIKNNCIVECNNLDVLIGLNQMCFYSCYGIPHHKANDLKASKAVKFTKHINQIIEQANPSALSAHYSMHEYLSANFKTQKFHFYGVHKRTNLTLLKSIVKDSATKIVLINGKRPF